MRLNVVASAGLVADGKFGPVTQQAVVNYQTNNAIIADGVVDVVTWERLFATVRAEP
jgi:peptidoglycan hydrolase-like protein with peptidoglycan-binding domain